jgi:serine protease Do
MRIMRYTIPIGLAVMIACGDGRQSEAQNVRLYTPPPTEQIEASRRTAVVTAVERVSPSVVTVQTEAMERVPIDLFERFFGGRSGQRSVAGIGSGFIVRSDGYILTNAHVVKGATKISVALRDGTSYSAQIIGLDEANDLAVIKIDAKDLPVAPLGSSTGLLIGEWVIAIGNPYGFVLANTEPTVTVGVVSGVGRNLASPPEGAGVYVDMIQTDAAINPGNSGGPLVNAVGEVIGVNSSIYSPTGGSVGLGFAIPINRARRVAEDLIAHGAVRQPWIGVQPMVAGATNGRTTTATKGVIVASVAPESPAARAGIKKGDVIEQSRTRVLHNAYDWQAELLELRVGDTVPLTIRRGGQQIKLNVQVADMPEVNAPRVTVLKEIELVTLTPAMRAAHNVRSEAGAYVKNVSQRVAENIGLQPGDVIVQINRARVSSAEDAARLLNDPRARGLVIMYVERQGDYYVTEFQTR